MSNITIKTTVNREIGEVWDLWTSPDHIKQWSNASDDWHTTEAENDVRVGGQFRSRMEAKDGSMGFDFSGAYTRVEPGRLLAYTLDDGRKVTVSFQKKGEATEIVEIFEPEKENPVDMQRDGWQSILDSFKAYAETHQQSGDQ